MECTEWVAIPDATGLIGRWGMPTTAGGGINSATTTMSPTRQLPPEQDEPHPINSTTNDASTTTLDSITNETEELNHVCTTCSTCPITRSGDGGGGGASYKDGPP